MFLLFSLHYPAYAKGRFDPPAEKELKNRYSAYLFFDSENYICLHFQLYYLFRRNQKITKATKATFTLQGMMHNPDFFAKSVF